MINIVISNLFIAIVILMICEEFLLPICAINSLQLFSRATLLSDKTQKVTSKELMLDESSNILRNSSNRDENITLFNHPLPYYTTVTAFGTPFWQLTHIESAKKDEVRRSILEENVKIHNDFHYGINKSNQENNFYYNNKRPAPLLSNIKPVNSSTLSPSSSSQLLTSLTATAPASTESTNSTSSASSYFERVELHEALTHTKNKILQLHRNKRYLLFPEGSSFQLVFDLIIPIVDYTNFAIMGITCAVAWELPSKPPSEIIENFRTKLNEGTLGLSRRNDSTQQQLKYINNRRTEQKPVYDNKRWGEVGSENVFSQHYPQYQQQHKKLSATVTTTSGHENFLTKAPQPPLPTSSNFYFNNDNNYNQQTKFQQPTATTFFYSHLPQQKQHWHNYNFETFNTNQRKNLHANDNRERPIYRNEFAAQANNQNNNDYYLQALPPHPANKWNTENWQHQQPQQTKIPYNDAGDYWNKDNWWERNKNRKEKHWQENQQKWSQYQEK